MRCDCDGATGAEVADDGEDGGFRKKGLAEWRSVGFGCHLHCEEGVESVDMVGASVWGAWEGGVGVGEVFGGVVLVELGDVHFRVKGRRGDGGLCEADGDGGRRRLRRCRRGFRRCLRGFRSGRIPSSVLPAMTDALCAASLAAIWACRDCVAGGIAFWIRSPANSVEAAGVY